MTEPVNEGAADRPAETAQLRPVREMRLKSPLSKVVTLSKKAIVGGAAVIVVGAAATLLFVFLPHHQSGPAKELLSTNSHSLPDKAAALPLTYGGLPKGVPQVGSPLPGDLGKPMIEAGVTPANATSANTAAEQKRQQIAQEQDSARTSHLFTAEAAGVSPPTVPGSASPGAPASPPPAATPSSEDHKLAFLGQSPDRNVVSTEHVVGAASPFVLQAGAVIAASLITGLRSDLPGEITAQVTENVYDSPTGSILLIPQGARLVGQYDAQISFGQSRALMVWTRLVMPNGRSIILDRLPGADPEGYAGVQDQIDNHWGALFKAAALSTLLSVGSEAGTSNSENNLAQAIRQGASQSFSQVGEQVAGKQLSVQPTITVRPGFPLRVMVTKDLALEPYRA